MFSCRCVQRGADCKLGQEEGVGEAEEKKEKYPRHQPCASLSLVHSFNLDVLLWVIRAESLQNCQRLKFTTDIRTSQNAISNTSHASVRMHYNADVSLGLEGKL